MSAGNVSTTHRVAKCFATLIKDEWIANFAEIDPEADSGIFRDFEPELWMRCETQERIAEEVGVSEGFVSEFAKKLRNDSEADYEIFRDFEPELYTVWNFGKATKRARAALFGAGQFSATESKPHERELLQFTEYGGSFHNVSYAQ